MTKESPASAPMRIGGRMKQKTPVSAASKPADLEGTAPLKKSAKASNGGPNDMKTKTDKKMTDRLDRKSLKGESKSTMKAVKRGEGRKPPREGMGSVGATMGRDRDSGRSLENAGQTAKKVRPRNT